MIINGVNFDNTLSVKQQAKLIEASDILNKTLIGSQTQLFNIGDKVEGNGWTGGTITDAWNTNGFQYYECTVKRGRKTFTHRERQQDISLIQ